MVPRARSLAAVLDAPEGRKQHADAWSRYSPTGGRAAENQVDRLSVRAASADRAATARAVAGHATASARLNIRRFKTSEDGIGTNNRRITTPVVVQRGDVLQVGQTLLRFE